MGSEPRRAPVLAAAFLAGAQGLLAQGLLLREELLLFGGNEVAVGAFLGLWLVGVAVGALAARRADPRSAAAALVAQPLLLLLCAASARTARALSGVPAYEPFPLAGLLLWSLPIALPVPAATGATLPALTGAGRRAGLSVTAVYVSEALGSFAGGVGLTLLLAAGCDPGAILLGSVGAGAAAAALVVGRRLRFALACAALAAAAGAPTVGPSLGAALRARQVEAALPGSQYRDGADTATGFVALASLRGQEALLGDGAVLAAFPDPERVGRAAGALAALSGAPRRLLVTGGEAVDLLPGLLGLRAVEQVVWLVADPGFARFAARHVPGLSDPRLRVVVDDPARVGKGALAGADFDAVWVLAGPPARRADDRFLALEGLRSLAGLLSEEGVLLVSARSAENYVGPRLRAAVGAVAAAVAAVLPSVRLLPGEDGLLLASASSERLRREPEDLARLYRALGPDPVRLAEEDFRALLDPRRVEEADRLLGTLLADSRVVPSTAERPAALFHSLVLRAERESPDLAEALEGLRDRRALLAVPLGVLLLLGIAGVARRAEGARGAQTVAAAVLGAAGAAGMALDLVLLHVYQGRFGTLYLEAGWLFGIWMAGFAAGGLGMRRLCSEGRARALGAAVFLLSAAGAAVLAVLGAAAVAGRAAGALGFLAAGGLTGAVLPVAEAVLARGGVKGASAGSTVGAADHLGGAAAALLLGVAVIPVAGVRGAAVIAAALALFGAGVLGLSGFASRRGRGARAPPGGGAAFAMAAAVCAAVAGNWAGQVAGEGGLVRVPAETLGAAGLPEPWEEAAEPVVHYRSRSPEGGVAVASRSVGRFSGYGGSINLLVVAAPDGTVRRVSLLEHRETPAYVEGIGAFLDSFRGRSLAAPFALRVGRNAAPPGQTVDALTGATVTSRAVVDALEATGKALSAPVFGRPYAAAARVPGAPDPRTLYLVAGLSLAAPVLLWGGRRARRAWFAAHAAVGGLWLGVQFSSVQVLTLLRLEVPAWGWTGLLAVAAIASAALWGPVYCGYLCPAGALQELLSWAGGLVGAVRPVSAALVRALALARHALLAAVVVGALGLGLPGAEDLDPIRALWASGRHQASWLILGLAALGCLLSARFACRGLCPAGAFLGLANRFAPLRARLPGKRYSACDLGVRAEGDTSCVQCYRCRDEAAGLPASRGHSAAAGWVLAGVLAAAVWAAILPAGAGGGPSDLVRVEAVDRDLLRRKIEAGTLSDRPALYWRRPAP